MVWQQYAAVLLRFFCFYVSVYVGKIVILVNVTFVLNQIL